MLWGSKLNLNVPVNNIGSYGIIVTFSLKLCNPTLEISIPSKIIFPNSLLGSFDNSKILIKPKVMVDLPLPVLPTIPTFSSDLI